MQKDLIAKIVAYEDGRLTVKEVTDFFQELLTSGVVWELQGHYERTTLRLLADGSIYKDG